PIHAACINPNAKYLKQLLNSVPEYNIQDRAGFKPVHYAIKNGHSPVAAYLLRLGVNPDSSDTSGNTTVHYAAAYGWIHCLRL
ncbi:predicted protein, partial [Nematostella vectensis]